MHALCVKISVSVPQEMPLLTTPGIQCTAFCVLVTISTADSSAGRNDQNFISEYNLFYFSIRYILASNDVTVTAMQMQFASNRNWRGNIVGEPRRANAKSHFYRIKSTNF